MIASATVDLPEPLSPVSTSVCPGASANDTSLTALTIPSGVTNSARRPCTCRIGSSTKMPFVCWGGGRGIIPSGIGVDGAVRWRSLIDAARGWCRCSPTRPARWMAEGHPRNARQRLRPRHTRFDCHSEERRIRLNGSVASRTDEPYVAECLQASKGRRDY